MRMIAIMVFDLSMQALTVPRTDDEQCAVTQALSSPLTLCSLLLSVWAVIGFVGLIRPASIAFVGALCSRWAHSAVRPSPMWRG